MYYIHSILSNFFSILILYNVVTIFYNFKNCLKYISYNTNDIYIFNYLKKLYLVRSIQNVNKTAAGFFLCVCDYRVVFS